MRRSQSQGEVVEWVSETQLAVTQASAMLAGKDRLQRSVLQMREGVAGEELVGLAFRGALLTQEATDLNPQVEKQPYMAAKNKYAVLYFLRLAAIKVAVLIM